jgi:hypothetical protein
MEAKLLAAYCGSVTGKLALEEKGRGTKRKGDEGTEKNKLIQDF